MKTGTILISGFEFTAGVRQFPRPILRAPGSRDIQNQTRFVGTPHIMNSSVLTTCKGFMRTCWIFCLFCLTSFIFNWRIIALQDCVGFCHTSAWISHRYTYVPSLLNLPHSKFLIMMYVLSFPSLSPSSHLYLHLCLLFLLFCLLLLWLSFFLSCDLL